jgi:hypothetical protein
MSENNSAAAMLASSPVKVENISLPGFGAGNMSEVFDPLKYRVRYAKIDLDDPGCLAELEILETKGLAAKEIIVLNKDKFTFMDKYIMVVTYLELIPTV